MRLIDADALVEKLCGDCFGFGNKRCQKPCYEETLIKTMPTIEAEKHGQWIEERSGKVLDLVRYHCSECGRWQTWSNFHYCPNCGARMVP